MHVINCRSVAAGLLLTLVSCTGTEGQELPPEGSVPRQALPSVVTIESYGTDGNPIGLGSGFLLRDGRIVTNNHVVAGAEWVEITDQEEQLLGTVPYAEVISTRSDLAILPAVETESTGLLLSEDGPDVGESVWAIGSPQGLEGSVSSGIVSAVRSVEGQEYVQISAPISSGSSGGPILDADGQVIGVVVHYVTDGQNLNFGVPSSRLRALRNSPAGRYALNEIDPPTATTETAGSSEDEWVGDVIRVMRDSPMLTLPASEQGALTRSDFEGEETFVDFYRFQGDRGDEISISMQSQTIDTHVGVMLDGTLEDDSGWVRTDDDGGEGTNSLLTVTLPRSGQYIIVATSYEREVGRYALSVQRGSPAVSGRPTGDDELDSRWRYVGSGGDSDRWYWDTESLSELALGHLVVWVQVQYRQHESGYDYSKQRWQINCDGRRAGLQSIVAYSDGNIADQDLTGGVDWVDVVPGSIGEGLMESVCSARH